MSTLYTLQSESIEPFSQDWDDRQQLQDIATQLDKMLDYINAFGICSSFSDHS